MTRSTAPVLRSCLAGLAAACAAAVGSARFIAVFFGLVIASGALDTSRPAAQIVFGPRPPQGPVQNVPPCQFVDVTPATADAWVMSRAQLEAALASGRRRIWIENGAAIDLAVADHRANPKSEVLRIPSNVTLASGRTPTSLGGLLYFSRRIERPRFMLRLSDCTRVTGLRLRGPSRSTERFEDSNVAIGVIGVRDVLIDNNEFSDWPGSGVNVWKTGNAYSSAQSIRITGNFFHHNLMCDFGNGVVVNGDSSSAVGGYAYIARNVFNYNRHAVAGDGHPASGYVAKYNLVLSGGKTCGAGHYNQHFDMHGYDEGGYGGDAGQTIDIGYNTIRGEQKYYVIKTRPAFQLRGNPTGMAYFYGNVVAHDDRDEAVRVHVELDCSRRSCRPAYEPNLQVGTNQYNVDTSHELAVGDFDGDGVDDVFQATGNVWVFSARGRSDWRVLSAKSERLSRLRFGDFDGDRKTDVFTQQGARWMVSYGGVTPWTRLPAGSSVDMSGYRVGDFDGDGKADIFVTTGQQWFYSKGAAGDWERLAKSGHRADMIRFGDFNGDGATDVFGLVGGAWKVAYGGSSGWQYLNREISSNLKELVFADFNGDRFTDIARQRGTDYQVSWGGSTDWSTLHGEALEALPLLLPFTVLGDFDGDASADVLHYERSIVSVRERFVISRGGREPFVKWSRHEMR